jgi:ketopantoate hydroxymethyltransferase
LLHYGDLLTDKAEAGGTSYRVGQLVVTKVYSADVLVVGDILRFVVRNDSLLLVISVHDAIRHQFQFFQACPRGLTEIVDYKNLADYKPLIKRDASTCFRFFLHHHIPTPPYERI